MRARLTNGRAVCRRGRPEWWAGRRVGAHGGPAAILGCAGTNRFVGPMRARLTNGRAVCRRGRPDWWAGRPVGAHGGPAAILGCAGTNRFAGPMRARLTNGRAVCRARAARLVGRTPRRGTRRAGGDPRLCRQKSVRRADACPVDEWTCAVCGRGRPDWWAGRHVGAHGGPAAILGCAGSNRFAGPMSECRGSSR